MWERAVRCRRVFVLREVVEAARCASGGLSEGWGWETIRPGALCIEEESASPEAVYLQACVSTGRATTSCVAVGSFLCVVYIKRMFMNE